MSVNFKFHNKHSYSAQYIKVQIKRYTIDPVLSYKSMESDIMEVLSVFLSILEAFFIPATPGFDGGSINHDAFAWRKCPVSIIPCNICKHAGFALFYGPDLHPQPIIWM